MLKKKILGILLVLGTCTACITQAETTLIGPECNGTPTTNYMQLRVRVDLEGNNTYYIVSHTQTCAWGYTDYKERHQNTYEIDENGNIWTWNLGEKYLGLYHAGFRGSYTDRARRSASRTTDGLAYAGRSNRNSNTAPISGIITTFSEADYQQFALDGTELTINELKNTVGGKIDGLSIWGGIQNSPTSAFGRFCYDSSELNKSYCMKTIEGTYPLTWSNGDQPTTYFGTNGTFITESPLIGGGSNNTTNTPCITIEQLLNMGGSDYNTGMCYTDSKYWSGNATTGEYIYITPQSIFTLYPTYTELREDMNIYNNYCNNYVATQQACITAFSGSKGLNITLLDKLKGKESTRLNTLYDYCKTREVYSGSLDTSTCDLTDEDIKNIVPSMLTPEGQAENAMQQGITTTNPKEGSVFDGLTDETARDLFEAIPRVYQKITGIFNDRSGVNGIIPDYITRILLAIILFAIFKK